MQTRDVVGQGPAGGPGRETEERPQPLPEKKGAEDTGEPVPSQPPPKETERR